MKQTNNYLELLKRLTANTGAGTRANILHPLKCRKHSTLKYLIMISKQLKPATCLYGTETKPLNKKTKQTNKQLGVYLHDASYQYTEDVGLEQRSPQTHSASTFLLYMLLYFLSLFRCLSPVATSSPFSPSSWVLLSRFTISTFLISAPPFLLSAYTVHGVAHVDQAGSGHKHNLEHL